MLGDNLADLAAQAAANHHGVRALQELAQGSSREVVLRNMAALGYHAAEVLVEALPLAGHQWQGEDLLDDGTPVRAHLRCSKRITG